MAIKKTFAEAKAEAEANRHNSNMANLASACNMIAESIEGLDAKRAELVFLREEIEKAGSDPEVTYERIRQLYNQAFDKKYIVKN